MLTFGRHFYLGLTHSVVCPSFCLCVSIWEVGYCSSYQAKLKADYFSFRPDCSRLTFLSDSFPSKLRWRFYSLPNILFFFPLSRHRHKHTHTQLYWSFSSSSVTRHFEARALIRHTHNSRLLLLLRRRTYNSFTTHTRNESSASFEFSPPTVEKCHVNFK